MKMKERSRIAVDWRKIEKNYDWKEQPQKDGQLMMKQRRVKERLVSSGESKDDSVEDVRCIWSILKSSNHLTEMENKPFS